MRAELYSPDISCEGCAQTIRKVLGSTQGIKDLKVEVETRRIWLDFDETVVSLQQIKERLFQAGYDTELRE